LDRFNTLAIAGRFVGGMAWFACIAASGSEDGNKEQREDHFHAVLEHRYADTRALFCILSL
jgi:hypothetical protein